MRRMGTHPGCVASNFQSKSTVEFQRAVDAAHPTLHSHAAHGNEEEWHQNFEWIPPRYLLFVIVTPF
jgi:hypothetical protein